MPMVRNATPEENMFALEQQKYLQQAQQARPALANYMATQRTAPNNFTSARPFTDASDAPPDVASSRPFPKTLEEAQEYNKWAAEQYKNAPKGSWAYAEQQPGYSAPRPQTTTSPPTSTDPSVKPIANSVTNYDPVVGGISKFVEGVDNMAFGYRPLQSVLAGMVSGLPGGPKYDDYKAYMNEQSKLFAQNNPTAAPAISGAGTAAVALPMIAGGTLAAAANGLRTGATAALPLIPRMIAGGAKYIGNNYGKLLGLAGLGNIMYGNTQSAQPQVSVPAAPPSATPVAANNFPAPTLQAPVAQPVVSPSAAAPDALVPVTPQNTVSAIFTPVSSLPKFRVEGPDGQDFTREAQMRVADKLAIKDMRENNEKNDTAQAEYKKKQQVKKLIDSTVINDFMYPVYEENSNNRLQDKIVGWNFYNFDNYKGMRERWAQLPQELKDSMTSLVPTSKGKVSIPQDAADVAKSRAETEKFKQETIKQQLENRRLANPLPSLSQSLLQPEAVKNWQMNEAITSQALQQTLKQYGINSPQYAEAYKAYLDARALALENMSKIVK